MKKTIVAAVLAVLLLASAAPALAQGEGTSGVIGGTATVGPGGSSPAGSPPSSGIPDYRFADGGVLIGGDIMVDCTAFAESIEEERTPSGDIPAGALDALDECAGAGLLSASFVASVRASSDGSDGGGGDEQLPDTGGPVFWVPLCVLGMLLTGGVLVARKVAG